MKAIQFSALLDKIESRKDRSLKVIISTQELGGADMAELFGYRDQLGYVTFTPNPESNIEVPDEPATDDSKSPSQRLRSVLFVLYKQSYTSKFDKYNQFYDWYMEEIISQVKEKLDE